MSETFNPIQQNQRKYIKNVDQVKFISARLHPTEEYLDGVEDGDTIIVDIYDDQGNISKTGVRIREGSGIDTPETLNRTTQKKDPTLPSYQVGMVATRNAQGILKSGKLYLIDKKVGKLPEDKYGRNTNIIVSSDGKLLCVEQLSKGLADTKYLRCGYEASDLMNKEELEKLERSRYIKEKPVAEKIREVKDISKYAEEFGWIDDRGRSLPGALKLGIVWLPVPPSHITFTEVNENESIPTVRTPGTPKIKTGRQEIRIELELFFPSLRDINTKFRPLLAQFLRSPFLPLENEHIRNFIYPSVMWSEPEEKIMEQKSHIPFSDNKVYERTVSKDMTTGLFYKTNKGFQEEVHSTYLKLKEQFEKEREKLIAKRKAMPTPDLTERPPVYRENINKINKLEADILDIEDKISKLSPEKIAINMIKYKNDPLDTVKVQLAVAVRDIVVSTVPGYPECLQCNLTLSVFNFKPYSKDFEFLKDIESAMKQIEYYNSRTSFQYPEGVRKFLSPKVYKNPKDLKITSNLSESEPFLMYIAPLLQGEMLQGTRQITMKLEESTNNKEDTLNRQFIFVEPENWLRSIKNVKDFKTINLEYMITELSLEESETMDLQQKRLLSEIIADTHDLLENLGYTQEILLQVWREFKSIINQLYKVISLEVLAKRVEFFKDELADAYKRTIIMPIDIPFENPILKKGQLYSLKDFKSVFEKLGGGRGRNIINKILKQYQLKSRSTYGHQNKYKFNFTEDDDTIITGMSASVSNRLATIPLLNYSLPTFQHMGRGDWIIQLNLQTCNNALLKILRSLSIKANESRIIRHRSVKNYWINKLNSIYFDPNESITGNGFFKLLGVNYVLFDSIVCETIREKPGWWNITLRLVQSDLDLFLYESLLPVDFFSDDVIMDTIEDVKKKYTWKNEPDKYKKSLEKLPYLTEVVFPNIRNFVYRLVLNIFYGGADIGAIPDVIGTIKGTEKQNKYIVTDKEVTKLINSGLKKEDFMKLMENKFKLFAGLPQNYDFFDVQQTTKEESKGITLTWIPYREEKESGKATIGRYASLPEGKSITSTVFKERLNIKLTELPIPSKINKIGEDVRWMLTDYFLRVTIIRCLLVAWKEIKSILSKPHTDRELHPTWNIQQKFAGTEYDLYSNYLDLNLPSYRGGVLSTPADFFYKRSDDIFPVNFLKEKITKTHDMSMNAWKFQLVDGLSLYNKMKALDPIMFPYSEDDLTEAKKEMEQFKEIILKTAPSFYDPWFTVNKKGEFKINLGLFADAFTPKYHAHLKTYEILGQHLQDNINTIEESLKEFQGGKKTRSPEDIVNLAKKIGSYWDSNLRNLPLEDKQKLCFSASVFEIRQAMGIVACLRLAAVEDALEEQNKNNKSQGIVGVSIQFDKLSLLRQELISQIDMYTKVSSMELYGTVTPYSMAKTEDIFNRVVKDYYMYRAKDKTFSMERAYPTMKLYFIEEDSKQWGAFDDYYMYNAVESIEVIKSKNSASSLANITISNISQNLTDPFSINRKEAPLKEGTLLEQSVFSLYLREGITIMVKAGFDNNPANLDTIFLGKIISSTTQDRVTIVAQGFGAELLEPVNSGLHHKLGYNSAARTHGDVVLWAFNTINGLEHFGSPNAFERLGLVNTHGDTPFYASQKWRTWDYLRRLHPILDFYFKFTVYDPRFENIYLPYSKIAMSPWTQNLANMIVGTKIEPGMALLKAAIGLTLVAATIALTACVLPFAVTGGAIAGGLYVIGNLAFHTWTFWAIAGKGVAAISSYYFGGLIADGLNKNDNNMLFWNSTFDWIIKDNTSCWDLLNEIALYHDDYIVSTLPYNDMIPGQTRQTIYMGPRDGYYKATDMFDSAETMEKIKKDITNKRKFIGMVLDENEQAKFKENVEKYKEKKTKFEIKIKKKGLSNSEIKEYNIILGECEKIDVMLKYIKDYNNRDLTKDKESNSELVIKKARDKAKRIKDTNAMDKLDILMQAWAKHDNETLKKYGISVRDWNRLDEVSKHVQKEYSYLTKEAQYLKVSPFESTGIMWSINNPDDLVEDKLIRKDMVKVPKYDGYIPVVNYYYVDSFSHIISNNIRASAEDVYNHVVVKYPPDPTIKQTSKLDKREFWADDNIKGSYMRTYVSEQTNIDPLSVPLFPKDLEHWLEFKKNVGSKLYGRLPRIYQVGYNILANYMRPMYRGEITVIGMPYVRPFDIIYVNDYYNKMWGPIEVETVKHRFSADGFTTEITPNAVITYMNPGKVAQLGFMNGLRIPFLGIAGDVVNWNVISTIGSVGAGVTTLAGGGAAMGLSLGAASPWLIGIGSFAAGFGITLGLSLWNWGVGKFMGRDIINLIGLWQNNHPMVAGMEGAYKDNIQVHMWDQVRSLVDFELAFAGGK